MKRCDEDSGRGDLKGDGGRRGLWVARVGLDVRENKNKVDRGKWCGQEAIASL